MITSWKQLKELLPYFPPGTKQYIWVYIAISSLLTLLDIAALMLLALSLSGMLSGGDIHIPVVGAVPPEHYVWLLLTVSLLVLVKSAATVAQQWMATRRFAEFELTLGLKLFDAYIGAPWVQRLYRSSSQLVRMADVGVSAAVGGLVLPLIQLPALIVSSTLILVTLFVLQPMTAIISLFYLGLIAFLMSKVLTKKAVEAGRVNRNYSYKVASIMTDMVGALKEITLRNKFDEVAEVVKVNRVHAARARANIQFLGTVPKFVLDTALIGGFLIVGGVSYVLEGSLNEAIAAVVMFAVAGMRLVPALTSFQSINNGINANRAQVDAILRDMKSSDVYRAEAEDLGNDPLSEDPQNLILENVTFTYPTGEQPAVTNVSMMIPMGSSIGIVGESGSGKSTLVDIVLGLLVPQEGTVRLDAQNLEDVLGAWRSQVGYVPQEVSLFDGTIEQNVSLTFRGKPDRAKVIESLKKAQLWETVKNRPGGLEAKVGERGIALSGGQRQRMGIARALYSDPYVLILDEATSALDTRTESEVAKAIANLRGDVTTVSIAHRLSTVKDVDTLFFMEDGFILAQGTFDEVVARVPTFREQAQLAGLVEGLKKD